MTAPPGRPQAIVVGAGPVGLAAAYELARRGPRMRVADAGAGPARTGRAAGGTGPGDTPVGVAPTAAVQYGEWLSVRTVGGTGTDRPAPLADAGARLRAALQLDPGRRLLVRPEGYGAARGDQLTRAALNRSALNRAPAPLRPAAPPTGQAAPEPDIARPAPTYRPEEH